MAKTDRQGFLDILRVAATCAVVLLHTVTVVMDATDMNAYPLEKTVFLAIMDLITWCVPVFVLISGYLFLNPMRRITFGQMLKKYCRRIVIALFIFGVPYACMEQIMAQGSFRASMIGRAVLMVLQGRSWSHMWYLYMILFLYLITPALKYMLKRMPGFVLYGMLFILFAGSSILPFIKKLCNLETLFAFPDGGIYLFYYLWGYLFALPAQEETGSGRITRKVSKKIGAPIWYGAVFAGILLAMGMVLSRLFESYTVQMAYNYPFTVVLSLLLMWIFREAEGKLKEKHRAFWVRSGALCFGVYLIHPVFVNFYYKFLQTTPLNFPEEAFVLGCIPRIFASLPLFFFGALLPAVIGAWVLMKIPVMRKYVL